MAPPLIGGGDDDDEYDNLIMLSDDDDSEDQPDSAPTTGLLLDRPPIAPPAGIAEEDNPIISKAINSIVRRIRLALDQGSSSQLEQELDDKSHYAMNRKSEWELSLVDGDYPNIGVIVTTNDDAIRQYELWQWIEDWADSWSAYLASRRESARPAGRG